jgi:UDP-glucose 4-epimerase
MKLAITGGSGFIGSHLTEFLISESNHEVVIYDNNYSGDQRNLSNVIHHGRLDIIQGDVLNKNHLSDSISDADRIYHLAAIAGVGNVISKQIETLRTNIDGTRNVLNIAAKNNIPLFIASTSDVYGKSGSVPFTEQSDRLMGPTTIPRWAYASAKVIDEYFALAYVKKYKLPVVIGRFFNVSGARQSKAPGTVIPTFVDRALSDKPIIIHGDGSQIRSFTHVNDAVRAMNELMLKPQDNVGIYNIGSENKISIINLANLVVEQSNSNSSYQFQSHDSVYGTNFEDSEEKVPDISKLKRTIGYKPSYSTAEIVQDVLDFARKSGHYD